MEVINYQDCRLQTLTFTSKINRQCSHGIINITKITMATSKLRLITSVINLVIYTVTTLPEKYHRTLNQVLIRPLILNLIWEPKMPLKKLDEKYKTMR